MATYDEDQEALAAEYVLGTLSAEEREHADALRTFDPGFEAAVLQWERRLGELNVMVEAVEPPAELWDKIKTDVAAAEPAPHAEPPRESGEPAAVAAPGSEATAPAPVAQDTVAHTEAPAAGAAAAAGAAGTAETVAPAPAIPADEPRAVARSADTIDLAGRARRWRGAALAFAAIAALLALYVALSRAAPDLLPGPLRPHGVTMAAQADAPSRLQQDRLVAVLQQEPTAPAFLLTLDTRSRTLFVRRVSAAPEAGKSYELWLMSKRSGAPHSLGIVGSGDFTQRPLPPNDDIETLRGATYAVSLEPAGGSKTGAPTGPVLFTGRAVESLPASAPPKSASPKT